MCVQFEIPRHKSIHAHAGSGVFVQSGAGRIRVLESEKTVNHLLCTHTCRSSEFTLLYESTP